MNRNVRLIVALCAVLPCAFGCPGPRRAPARVILGIDTSGSAREMLPGFVAAAGAIGAGMEPHDHLTALRVDSDVREFYDQSAPESGETFADLLVREVEEQADERGTYPAQFWGEAADRAGAAGGAPTAIVLFTDAECDDSSTEARDAVAAAGRRLAGMRHVRLVLVAGASNRNWRRLRAGLAPLGSRVVLQTAANMDVEPVLRAIAEGGDPR